LITLRRRHSNLVFVLAATVIVGGCAPLFGLGQPGGWSFAADNRSVGIDYVIRYTSSETATYVLLSSGAEGLVQAGPQAPGPTDTVAILDPVSCRVISVVDPVPAGHNRIDLTSVWLYAIGLYDPTDYGDARAPEPFLPATDKCESADPAATPLPKPTMEAGTWLRGWEMYCEDRGGFSVRGETLDGATAGCEAHAMDIGQGPIGGKNEIAIWNPQGDMNRLGIAWKAGGCAKSATVSLFPTAGGYRVHVISIGTGCAPETEPFATIFHLTEPLDASLVQGDLERVSD
jgi:hypothetical protein